MLAAIASAAIMLDGADCWAARGQGLAFAFGARFDMTRWRRPRRFRFGS
jgi:hypothetical protein